jgi:hypothetical protein
MAYNAINNTVFAYKAVGDGSTVAQLNDNIEDTRTRVAVFENGSVKKAYGVEDVFTAHAQQSAGVITFDAPSSSTAKPSGSTFTTAIASGAVDVTGLVFGDGLSLTYYADLNYSISGFSESSSAYYTSAPSISATETFVFTITIDEGLATERVIIKTKSVTVTQTGSLSGSEILTSCGAPNPNDCPSYSPSRWTSRNYPAVNGSLVDEPISLGFALTEESATTLKIECDKANTPKKITFNVNVG